MENQKKDIIKGLIENGKIKEALDFFDQFTVDNKSINDHVIKLKSRYHINKKHDLNATLDSKEIAIENNKIVSSILELLSLDEEAIVNEDEHKSRKSKLKPLLIFLLSFLDQLSYC